MEQNTEIDNIDVNGSKRFTWISFYSEMADKLRAYRSDRSKLLDIIYGLESEFVRYIKGTDGQRIEDIDPFTVYGIFNRQIKEERRIDVCRYFKEKLSVESPLPKDFDGIPLINNMNSIFFTCSFVKTDVEPIWQLFDSVIEKNESQIAHWFDKVCKQQGVKWSVTMGLFWMRPNDYIALDGYNRSYLPQLGIDLFKDSELCFAKYDEVVRKVKEMLENKNVKEMNIPEVSYNAWSRARGEGEMNYWFVGDCFLGTESQLDRFRKDSLWEGRFDEKKKRDRKQLELARGVAKGDVLIVKSTSTKGKKHNVPFLRVKAVGVVMNDVEIKKVDGLTYCKCDVDYYGDEERDFEDAHLSSFRETIRKADEKALEVMQYADSLINGINDNTMKYKEYIELLLATNNLVLTGAPGTGKTYMAHKIAQEMNAEVMFVQFHPSYDYTDFVEGLRPIEKEDGQIGFERRDGIFKEFCKRAIKNYNDSLKSDEVLNKERCWEMRLQQFVDDAVEKMSEYTLTNRAKFYVENMENEYVVVVNKENEKTQRIKIKVSEIVDLLVEEKELIKVKEIREFYNRKYGTQQDSYTYILVNEILKMKSDPVGQLVEKEKKRNFVLIIDEINRGEVSKIFGELFYAIDPGYRGAKDKCVRTQYQNLVSESDVFADGFYLPENMYILATMNDIDRSVESMDFAMRRRFTWKEVKPSDTEDMLDSLPCAEKAKLVMKRVNDVIAQTEGLGEAYMIGASYFLKLEYYKCDFGKLWMMNIEPLMKEYVRGFRRSDEILKRIERAYNGGDVADKEMVTSDED